jgi:prepilin-type N-terminal cleavage/methylation domain-containing protein
MKILKKAFTLTELILALGIIGAIAALTVPSMTNNINKRIFATKLRNTVGEIKTLVDSEMILNHTKSLEGTDWGTTTYVFNKMNSLEICGGRRSATDSSGKNVVMGPVSISGCWPNNTYNAISGNNTIVVKNEKVSYAAKLKNGAVITNKGFSTVDEDEDEEDPVYSEYTIDLNGDELPNIIGRDLFSFKITKKGKIFGSTRDENVDLTKETKKCIEGSPESCFTVVVNSGWKMDY